MKLLQVDSSIMGENSVSRSLTDSIVSKLTGENASIEISVRDLVASPLPHIELSSLPGDAGDAAIASNAVLEEFLGADIVVVGAPMYNFTLASQLKAWLDRILIAGRTFRYGENGPEGLAGGKRVIIAVSRGGFYGPGSPAEAFEHLQTYLKAVFSFIGIEPEFIIAEGVAAGPEPRAAAIEKAGEAIAALAA